MEFDHDKVAPGAAVSLGESSDLALLGRRERAEWVVAWLRQGLDLHGDEIVTGPSDHIEFTATDPDVSFDDPQTLSDQELARKVFAKLANLALL